MTIQAKRNRKITTVSAYRMWDNSLDMTGPKTCWKQQWRQLHKKGYGDPDPRKIFLQYFSKFVESRMVQDEELIIGMDANNKDKINSDFRKFYTSNNLVEVFGHLHPGVNPPNKYQCGGNYIDYIFIRPALIPALKSTGFLPFNVPFVSDHSAAYANFDKEILFLGELNNPIEGANRNLIAGNPACQEHYCNLLNEHFT
eukprot:9178722-Ditylum_brightwellii.AAC.2